MRIDKFLKVSRILKRRTVAQEACGEDKVLINGKVAILPRAGFESDLSKNPYIAYNCIRLSGGTKTLKKLFIDRKIPAARRDQIPVIRDDLGILGVYSIGAHLDRIPEELPAVTIRFHK